MLKSSHSKLLIFSLITTALFSCNVNKNLGLFSKRKYTDGVFVQTHHKLTEPQQKNYVSASEMNKTEVKNVEQESKISNHPTTLKISDEDRMTLGSEVIVEKTSKNMDQQNRIKEKNKIKYNFSSINFLKNTTAKVQNKSTEALEINGKQPSIVEIIFAIIVPALGVYMYEGKTTTNFWVSLILMILIVSWIIASIFALLVIYGKIDLN